MSVLKEHMPNDAASSSTPSDDTSTPQLPWWVAGIQLVALAAHLPLLVVAGGGRALASPRTVLLISVCVAAASILLFLVVARFTRSKWTALGIVSVLTVFFWYWRGDETAGLQTDSPIVTLLIMAVTVSAAARFATHRYFRVGVFAATVALTVTAGAMIVVDVVASPESSLVLPGQLPGLNLPEKPDVVFVLVDGYARQDILQADYGFDNRKLIDSLEEAGFSVPELASANYNGTHLSIPSIVSMDYLTETGAPIHNSDLLEATAITGGDNRLVRALKGAGYTYVHGGTGNWNNSCGAEVDVCLESPAFDATAWAILNRTPIGPLLFAETGHPFTTTNLLRIPTLTNWRENRGEWSTGPVFAFVHLVMPHAPMYIDRSCDVRVDPALAGHVIGLDGISADELAVRRDAYVEQIECVNTALEAFVSQLDPDTVVVITADHGPDARGPLNGSAAGWDDLRILERYSTFSAIRLPEGCNQEVPVDHDLVNSFRMVLNCMDPSIDLPLLDPRYAAAGFKGFVLEIDDPDSTTDAD